MKKKSDLSSDQKKEYLRRLERRLDDLALVQERAEKEVKKVQKELGVDDQMVDWEKALGLFLLISATASFAYALVRDPIVSGAAVGVSSVGSPSLLLALTALIFVIYLVFPKKRK